MGAAFISTTVATGATVGTGRVDGSGQPENVPDGEGVAEVEGAVGVAAPAGGVATGVGVCRGPDVGVAVGLGVGVAVDGMVKYAIALTSRPPGEMAYWATTICEPELPLAVVSRTAPQPDGVGVSGAVPSVVVVSQVNVTVIGGPPAGQSFGLSSENVAVNLVPDAPCGGESVRAPCANTVLPAMRRTPTTRVATAATREATLLDRCTAGI